MTYEPACRISWESACSGMDEMRTVEQITAELNGAIATVKEIEQMSLPLSELALMRKRTAEYVAWRAICEANAVVDARAAIKQAKEQA